MKTDIDFVDAHRRARWARRRAKLTALALFACAVMLLGLVAKAEPLHDDRDITSGKQVLGMAASKPALIFDRPPLAVFSCPSFNFTSQTLCPDKRQD
ncbi:MAG: hypothetical protein AAF724_19645 [Pseudomonadota bacterium]